MGDLEGERLGVHIVTDSACNLPVAVCKKLGITVVPLAVQRGRESYLEGVDLDHADFYRWLRAGEPLSTSTPAPGAFYELFKRLTAGGDSVISVHLVGGKSAVVTTARLAAAMLPGADITVLDGQNVSLGLGYPVLLAARAARAGQSRAAILALLAGAAAEERLFAAIPDLGRLRRSGRVNLAQALLAGLLSIKPVLQVCSGAIDVAETVRAWPRAVAHMVDLAVAAAAGRPVHLGVAHTDAPGPAAELAERLAARFHAVETLVVEAGPALACHAGAGALAVVTLPVQPGEAPAGLL